MNPITNPFSRDEHPDLTSAILGVVNEAKAAQKMDEDYQTPSRAALCPLTEGIKNEDEFRAPRAALAMGRIYNNASKLFDSWSRGGNWDMLGYMYAGPQDLTPAHKAELQKWATSFEKLRDKFAAELDRYENPKKKTSGKKPKRK